MRFGLDLSLGAGRPMAGGVVLPPPATGGFAPLSGILDAANVVILGASIMNGGFGRTADGGSLSSAALETCFREAGFTGRLHSYASSGDNLSQTRVELARARADLAADEGNNLYVVHSGGNNVSANRPHPGGADAFAADYDALIAEITAAGDRVIPLPLTKRLYGKAGGYADPLSVNPGDPASEANGSKPYNDGIILPRIASAAPDWLVDGAAYADPYGLAARFPDLTGPDGIHGYGASIARYVLARLAGRAHGIAPGASRAGKSILYNIRGNHEPNDMSWGAAYNTFMSYRDTRQNHPWLFGAVCTDGSLDPHVVLHPDGTFQGGTGYGPAAYARIADTRFHHDAIVGSGLYVQGTQVLTLNISGLTPGDRMTMTCIGVRSAGGTGRRGDLTLTAGADAQTRTLDASLDAASNQVTFSETAVPATGEISLSLRKNPGSTYGYLHGMVLDFH